ncbi:hypothetical protein B0A48_17369 [Cryoendolithus antarcticus]|uniref:Uncharacterized protein n=1 Tax=Cryoendolithus antarcticus TaxID=1507870 RepID=A0A1V8SCL6_9PEZI|nr:hypothetical protein B0A48_17369 [Cryoendolithus antarcticus]
MASSEKQPSVFTTALYEPTPSDEAHSNQVQDTTDPVQTSERKPARSWRSTIILQLFSLAWLAPAVALLVLNIGGHTIGASAWCPLGTCWVQANDNISSVPQQRIGHFDSTSHNLLGFLQLISKILEIWFAFVAAGLVYLVVMRRATHSDGLPIRHMTLPIEFADPLRMMDHKLWKNLSSTRQGHAGPNETHRKRFGLSIIILATLLCILCNLMGPATAVLVIPALQWLDTPKVGDTWFQGFTYAEPLTDGWAFRDSGCGTAPFDSLNFTCANKWALSLDSWAATTAASIVESRDGHLLARMTQQNDVFFYVNTTKDFAAHEIDSQLLWVPSRQLVEEFSEDKRIIANISLGADAQKLNMSSSDFQSYAAYNKSLQMDVQRVGPIVGFFLNINLQSTWWTTDIDANRSVICISDYTLIYAIDAGNNFTRCIKYNRDGDGWGENVNGATLTIGDADTASNGSTHPELDVYIEASDRVVFLPNGVFADSPRKFDNGTVSTFQPECIGPLAENATTESMNLNCDWNYFFGQEYNDLSTSNASDSVTTFFYKYADGQSGSMVVDLIAFAAFTQYTFDPATLSNPMRLVQTPSLPTLNDIYNADYVQLSLDPTWWFAAMSLDYNNATLPAHRTIAQMLRKTMNYLRTGVEDPEVPFSVSLSASVFTPIFHTLSLLDWDTGTTKSTDEGTDWWPRLQRNARIQVWAYGLSSRTTYLGVTIVIAGALVVLAQFVLGLMDRRQSTSLTQTLVAALAHAPHSEFYVRGGDETKVAGTRFRVIDDTTRPGNLRFEAP